MSEDLRQLRLSTEVLDLGEDEEKRLFNVWLDKDDRDALNFIVFKHKAKSKATAVRVCIRMMALHLGYESSRS